MGNRTRHRALTLTLINFRRERKNSREISNGDNVIIKNSRKVFIKSA